MRADFPYDVSISHAAHDKPAARELAEPNHPPPGAPHSTHVGRDAMLSRLQFAAFRLA
uniref:Uncharacterized protein n=1 Tax=Candidatus Kentrum sp. TC TaxID=2126339 RepID=A0A450YB38_9GAMM|nr:MAG: hypothetical protein BECKTC1821E_GA0114239_100261 [Candidatus Kentron sp. TC]VFK38752.1 MAG: hypothetical protein BECKTC1821D_GA0114238_100559 [Candidatus Kentron sp. TC]VFK53226.1 MAG: hypothetical protein BECKTC1821F_GA0114240_100260 [Candidatus Kentron sp. TC]